MGSSSGLVFPDPFDYLTADAVRHMLRHQDAEDFLVWMREEAPKLHPGVFARVPDVVLWPSFATSLGTGLWNAMPLPRHDYRPEPLPRQRSGDLCRCRSGLGFDDCCALFPPPPPFKAEALWTFVAEQLPLEDLERVALAGRLNGPILGVVGMRLVERGATRRAARLLEKVFARPQDLGAEYEVALDALFDAYDALGWSGKKRRALVELSSTLRPPLRGVVWARRATIAADRGDVEEAWDLFSRARQDDPGNPSLAGLEVSLLLHQGRAKQASDRARFWLSKLKRQATDKPYRHLEKLLEDVIEDPLVAVWQFSQTVEPEHLKQVLALLESLEDRPLPDYGLERRGRSGHLVPPPSLGSVEQAWQDVWPQQEVLATADASHEDASYWSPDLAGPWVALLQQEPAALDSLPILEDLCAAAYLLEYPLVREAQERFLRPLLMRGAAIIDRALGDDPALLLPWAHVPNRPALRLFRRLALQGLELGSPDAAVELCERLLRLSPEDPVGIRCPLVDQYLHLGDDEKALSLCQAFEDDTTPEVMYGRVLALFRLQRRNEAEEALRRAHGMLPLVASYLTGKLRRKPRLDLGIVLHGGEEQAWYYRQNMLPVWRGVKGLLPWLRRVLA